MPRKKKQPASIASKAVQGIDLWAPPAMGYQSAHQMGLVTNHQFLSALAIEWIGICADFTATEVSRPQISVYRKAGVGGAVGGFGNGNIVDRRRNKALHDSSVVGRKAAGYADRAGDVEEIKDGPIVDLIADPNPYDSGNEYVRRLAKALQVTGNGYDLMVDAEGRKQLLPMLPAHVRVKPGKDDLLIEGFFFGKDRSNEQLYSAADVIAHRLLPSLDNYWYGLGFAHNVITVAQVFSAAMQHELAQWLNGIRPADLAIECGEGTTSEQADQIRTALKQRHAGARKGGEPLVMTNAKVVNLQRTSRDMEYREGVEAIRRQIMAAFGLPESVLLRQEGGITGSGAGSTAYGVYLQSTVLPLLHGILDRWNVQIVEWFGFEPGDIWFACENPRSETDKESAERARLLSDGGIITVNEARRIIGPDYPDMPGGDELKQTGTVDPFGGFLAGTVTDLRSDANKPGTITDRSGEGEDETPGTVTDLRTRSLRVKAGMRSLSKQVEDAVSKYLRSVAEVIAESTNVLTGDTVRIGTDVSLRTGLERALDGVGRMYQAGYALGMSSLGLQTDAIKAAQAYLRDYRENLITTVSDTVAMRAREAVAQSLLEGSTASERIEAVRQALNDGAVMSAERIARSEATNATNAGANQAWNDSGVVKGKRWLQSGGPCPFCAAMDGKTVPIDAPFLRAGETLTAGGESMVVRRDVYAPGLHPNCQCGMEPIISENAP